MTQTKPILATAWRPHMHSVERFFALYPQIASRYSAVSIVTPPDIDIGLRTLLARLSHVTITAEEGNRRLRTLQQSLSLSDATHIHYCDGDHLVARLENYINEWNRTLEAIPTADCLIVGRTEAVFESYPAALRETERIINRVASHLLGQQTDLGAGERGFSRAAVEHIITCANPETHAIATDSEYPILLHKAGFSVKTHFSAGTFYEVENERHQAQLTTVAQWEKRVKLADMIIATAIATASSG